MKIIIFAAFYFPYKGGYVESIRGLAKRLANRGHTLLVITCNIRKGCPQRETIDGVEVYRMRSWNPKWLHCSYTIPRPISLLKAWFFLWKREWHVVSTQTRFFPTTWMGWAFAKAKNLPLIHTERGSCHSISANRLVQFIGRLVDCSVGRLIFASAGMVVGVSRAARLFAVRMGARRTTVIYNGIDADFWQKRFFNDTSNTKNKGDELIITAMGRLVPAKGIQDLIKAVAALKNDKIKVKIMGGGPYRNELVRLSRDLKISGQVEFLGELSRERVRRELAESDLFVNPSYSEGLPRTILEAAAIRLPIIAYDVGGTGEIIENGKSGILINAGDSLVEPLRQLLGNIGLRKQLAAAARRKVVRYFSWEPVVSNYERVFMEAVHKHQSAS